MAMRLPAWLRVLGTLGFLTLVLWRVPVAELRSAFDGIRLGWLAPAALATAAMLGARWLRWHRLLATGGAEVSAACSARSLLGGFTLSLVLPGRSGELARWLFLPRELRGRVLPLNLLDRALDAWALATFGVVSLFFPAPHQPALLAAAVWLATLPLVNGLPVLLESFTSLPFFRRALGANVDSTHPAFARFRPLRFAPLALVSTGLDLAVFYFLLCAFQEAGLGAALASFPWIVTAGGLPLSVAGIGPREGAAVLLLGRFAVSRAAALNAAAMLFVFSALIPAALGGLLLLATRLGLHPGGAARPRRPPFRFEPEKSKVML
jgi:uncharacterized membrane protein YbhN (UPF0104 family)